MFIYPIKHWRAYIVCKSSTEGTVLQRPHNQVANSLVEQKFASLTACNQQPRFTYAVYQLIALAEQPVHKIYWACIWCLPTYPLLYDNQITRPCVLASPMLGLVKIKIHRKTSADAGYYSIHSRLFRYTSLTIFRGFQTYLNKMFAYKKT